MTLNTHHGRLLSCSALALTLAAALAGCGGGSTNGDAFGTTPSAYPFIYAYADNGGTPTSGLATGSSGGPASIGNPASTDVFLFTFASANSNPNSTLPGAGTFETGLVPGAGGAFTPGTAIPAAAPGGTYVFRAQGVQGQVSHTLEDIKTAGITPPGAAFLSFDPAAVTAYNLGTAAGPFAADSYVAHPVTIPASAGDTVVTIPATISDAAGHSTTTTFESVVLKPTDAAFASSATLSLPGVTPIYTYGPDASGTTVIIVPAGSYTPTVGGTPLTAAVTVAAGTVTTE